MLLTKLAACPQIDYPVRSRIHPLRSFAKGRYFVKREDELSFGISGSKIRKYRTLVPSLLAEGCQEAVVVGGAYSNNALSLAQVLIENGIKPVFYLRGPKPVKQTGNFLFLQLLVPESSFHWIERKEGHRIQQLATEYAVGRKHVTVIPEGAALFSAFLGALTLPLDILRNEKENDLIFDHLYIDAGTGYTAAAVLLVFAFLQKETICHVLLLADSEGVFIRKLQELHEEFEKWLGMKFPFPTQFRCDRSALAPSFGSTNRMLFEFISHIAETEGFFLDPVYSAKLFYHAKRPENAVDGNVLIIHSGGALALSGFTEIQREV